MDCYPPQVESSRWSCYLWGSCLCRREHCGLSHNSQYVWFSYRAVGTIWCVLRFIGHGFEASSIHRIVEVKFFSICCVLYIFTFKRCNASMKRLMAILYNEKSCNWSVTVGCLRSLELTCSVMWFGRFGTEEQRQALLPELTSMVYDSYPQWAVKFLQAFIVVDFYLYAQILLCSKQHTGLDVKVELWRDFSLWISWLNVVLSFN